MFKILKDELILAFSTASSETVLPRIMQNGSLRCAKAISSFVIPTGYSFNLDGSTLTKVSRQSLLHSFTVLKCQSANKLFLVVTLMITSKGIAGVPGVSFVVLLATLGSVGIPVEGLAFIAGVDRIMDMARTALNVVGNALAVLVISKWKTTYDSEKAAAYEATFK